MREFNNISIDALVTILTEGTIPERYYSLIPQRQTIIHALSSANITDLAHVLQLTIDELCEMTGLSHDVCVLLYRLFMLYRYIPCKMSEFQVLTNAQTDMLKKLGIKSSADFITAYLRDGNEYFYENAVMSQAEAEHIFSLCDLMRLPGVKYIRATLYYDCGYTSSKSFCNHTVEELIKCIQHHIESTGENKSLPLNKELRTQIALSTVLPPLK